MNNIDVDQLLFMFERFLVIQYIIDLVHNMY